MTLELLHGRYLQWLFVVTKSRKMFREQEKQSHGEYLHKKLFNDESSNPSFIIIYLLYLHVLFLQLEQHSFQAKYSNDGTE